MSLGGAAISLPWATVAAGETPDVGRLIALGAPLVQTVVRASIRRPAIALAITSVLSLGVALVSGQPAALQLALVRTGLGLVTAVLGIVAGSKGGAVRSATGVASIVTGVVQLGSLALTSVAALANPASLLTLVPSLVSQVAALAMAVKTTIVSFKR